MAITLTFINKSYFGAGTTAVVYNFTAAGSGDTLTVTVSGPPPFESNFMDANSNQIVTTPPTFGAWTTTGGSSSATVTANAGGVVTNGKMVLFTAGA
jgi:hypothetical protein